MITYNRMENIHLSDEQLYDLIKQNFRDGYYESAINLMETNPQLDEKILGQIAYNSMQNNLKHLQEQNDPDFKKDLIPLSYEPPTDLPINKLWFKILKEEKAVVEKTYAELKILKENNQLEVGQVYLLKDYVTKYQQPVSLTMKVGQYDLATATPSQIQEETEPLLLQAISKSEFAVECYSFKYPEDIIYYDFNDNICEDGSTPRNGFILRRYWVKNEVNVPNDWRHIKWARFKVDTTSIPTWTTGTVEKGKYYIVGNNIIKSTGSGIPTSTTDDNYFSCIVVEDYKNNYFLYDTAYGLTADKTQKKEYGTFANSDGDIVNYCNSISIDGEKIGENTRLLLNTVFKDLTNSNDVYSITSCNEFFNNTFGSGCYINTFGSSCRFNTFGNNCRYNTFGSGCTSNTFFVSCTSNTFGSNCSSNTFGSNCNDNTLLSDCDSNTFGSNCSSNTFGSNCDSNVFGAFCRRNSFLGDNANNIFGRNGESNTLGVASGGNVCDNGFNGNMLMSRVSGNSFGKNCSWNTICSQVYGNTYGDYTQYLFIKLLQNKNVSSISDLINKSYTNTIEQMSNGQYCYWYKTGTSYSNVTTVAIP